MGETWRYATDRLRGEWRINLDGRSLSNLGGKLEGSLLHEAAGQRREGLDNVDGR